MTNETSCKERTPRDSYTQYRDRDFDEVESDLGRGWDRAKDATKDSWRRVSDAVERATPGDCDRDGK